MQVFGIQNHPLGEAFRKIMLNFKSKLHPGSEIFEKVASNSLKIENVVFKITLEERTFFSMSKELKVL